MPDLKRTLGLWECIFFGVGSILGAGIYTLIGKVAGWAGNMTWLAFALAWLAAMFTAFSYAELCAAFPRAGGEFVFGRKAFGNKVGLALGFIVSGNGIVTGSAVSVGFAAYLTGLFDIPGLAAALGIIAVIFVVNALGIRESSVVNIIFTLIEVGGLLFVITLAVPHIGEVDYLEAPSEGLHGYLSAAALSFFAFVGFEELAKLSEEARDPARTIPRALLITSLIVLVVYTLVAVSAVTVIDWQQLSEAENPLAAVVDSRMGQRGVIIISVIALFSTSNTILSNMLGASRVLLDMAREHTFMRRLAFVSAKGRTPIAALVLILSVMSAFALIGNIEVIASIANTFIYITFLTINAAVIRLRVSLPRQERPFRVPLNIRNVPVTSVSAIVLIFFLLFINVYNLITR